MKNYHILFIIGMGLFFISVFVTSDLRYFEIFFSLGAALFFILFYLYLWKSKRQGTLENNYIPLILSVLSAVFLLVCIYYIFHKLTIA
ncbi:hypothetical protein [Thalassobacillus sp. C254]|uniref:hypothetical protein n=1 Tax=Thalassobacillus sp. C254 TaxID=1225341 RepID=UPI0006D1196C|nr:hypothetical protein [Thalassobacillus sp. C254]